MRYGLAHTTGFNIAPEKSQPPSFSDIASVAADLIIQENTGIPQDLIEYTDCT